MAKRGAIILAGGQAKRFQVKHEEWENKALARLFGKPLIIHIVERIVDVIDELVICVNERARMLEYSKVLDQYSFNNVKLLIDEKKHVGGPLVAIATGLKYSSADYCITLPCDVPLIQPTVVDHLFKVVKGSCVAVPIWPDGRLESLIVVYERPNAVQITDALCRLGRHRPDDVIRGAPKVTFVSTVGDLKDLDPEFKSFININSRGDLIRLPTRVVENGPIKENLSLNAVLFSTQELKKLKNASRLYREGESLRASGMFSSSSTRLERRGMPFWAGLCREKEGKSLFKFSETLKDERSRRDRYMEGKTAFKKAAQNYGLEAKFYEKKQIGFLVKRARTDQLWCQRHIK